MFDMIARISARISALSTRKKIILGVVIFLFLYFVWPTPYRFISTGGELYRVNRITGNAESVTGGGMGGPAL